MSIRRTMPPTKLLLQLRHKYSISVLLRAKSRITNITKLDCHNYARLRYIADCKDLSVVNRIVPRTSRIIFQSILICYRCRNYESFISFGYADRPLLPVLGTGYIKERGGRGRLRQRSDLDHVICHKRLSRLQWRPVRVSSSVTAWDCMGLHGTAWDYMAWDCMRLHEAGLPCLHNRIRSDRSHTIIVDDISFLQPF